MAADGVMPDPEPVLRDAYAPPPPPPAPATPEHDGVSRRALLRLGPPRGRPRAPVDHAAATARVRTTFESDAPLPLLRALAPVGEVLAQAAAVGAGDAVLDAGAGDGNVALACASRGAAVDACDLADAMVVRGRRRTGDAVRWRWADVQALPYADASFDAVISAFGAQLAPRPLRTVGELVRVCRPGGRIALAAWLPRGLPGRLDEFVEVLAPLPAGVPAPAQWGRRDVALARLEPVLEDVEVRTRTVTLAFESADACFAALAPAALDAAQRTALRPAFDRLLASVNNRPPAVELDARYLVLTGRRPADQRLPAT